MKKRNLGEKFMKRFYGISGPLDEYKRQEVNRIGNNAFVFLFYYTLFANLLACLFGVKYPEQTLWGLIIANITVMAFGICLYIMAASADAKLTENEVESKDVPKTKQGIIKSGIYSGIFFAVLMHLINGLFSVVGDGADYAIFIDPRRLMISLAGGILFGAVMMVIALGRVKKIDE